MSTVSKSFTAVGNGDVFRQRAGEKFTYSVSGTFAATALLEKKAGSDAWVTVVTATGAASGTIQPSTQDETYRFRCSAFTSGTVVTSIADATDTLETYQNADGTEVLKITEAGIETPAATITDLTSTTSTAGSFKKGTDELISFVDVVVSSAEILALNATPKQLVAAPGSNKILVFVGAVFFLDYNSAAYAGIAAGEDWTIKYTNGSGTAVAYLETTGFLDATSDQYRVAEPVNVSAAVLPSYTPVANAALVLHQLSGEITTGNSPVAVRVYYRTIDLSTLVTV